MDSKELKTLRLSAGLTQERLARLLDCSLGLIVKLESGKLRIKRLNEIAIRSVCADCKATKNATK